MSDLTPTQPPKPSTLWRFQAKAAPYVLLLPFFFVFATFMVYPLGKSIYLAFHQTNGPKSVVFIGMDNFRFLLTDPDFWTALRNTATYAFFSVFLQLPLSLGLALLLNSRFVKCREFFRLAFFSPHLVGQVFVAVLFGVLYAPRYGLINQGLSWAFGIDANMDWKKDHVMAALVVTALWMYVGFNMIYFLAALQGVDPDLYEAAMVDGANAFQQFWYVTLPSIRPVMVFIVVLSTIGAFQLFELPFVLLQGPGPNNAGLTIVMYLYLTGFEAGDLGLASAIGWILVLVILSISLIQLKVGRAGEAD